MRGHACPLHCLHAPAHRHPRAHKRRTGLQPALLAAICCRSRSRGRGAGRRTAPRDARTHHATPRGYRRHSFCPAAATTSIPRATAKPAPESASDDPARAAVDELLFKDAFDHRKPILAICHGTQTLNVWRGGSLIQDLKTPVNRRPGREVVEAHPVNIKPGSRLTEILTHAGEPDAQVNSSHHQAIRDSRKQPGVTAVSPNDGVVEAVELDASDHFVVGVQWHPERTTTQSEFSRAIFCAFIGAAKEWQNKEQTGNGAV